MGPGPCLGRRGPASQLAAQVQVNLSGRRAQGVGQVDQPVGGHVLQPALHFGKKRRREFGGLRHLSQGSAGRLASGTKQAGQCFLDELVSFALSEWHLLIAYHGKGCVRNLSGKPYTRTVLQTTDLTSRRRQVGRSGTLAAGPHADKPNED